MTEQETRALFCAKTGRVATIAHVEYQAFLFGLGVSADRIEALERELTDTECEANVLRGQLAEAQAVLHQAREALRDLATVCSACKDGPENEFCCRKKQWDSIAAIDAVLSGAPPSEITDERIRELIFDHTGLTLRDGDSYREIKNLVRAVLAEGRKG